MGGINITKEHADMLVGKLQAQVLKGGRAHDMAVVRFDGREIANFGIRHGSRKDAGHGHIPKDLHISPAQCRRLAVCTLSTDEWITILRDKGFLPKEEPPANQPPQSL